MVCRRHVSFGASEGIQNPRSSPRSCKGSQHPCMSRRLLSLRAEARPSSEIAGSDQVWLGNAGIPASVSVPALGEAERGKTATQPPQRLVRGLIVGRDWRRRRERPLGTGARVERRSRRRRRGPAHAQGRVRVVVEEEGREGRLAAGADGLGGVAWVGHGRGKVFLDVVEGAREADEAAGTLSDRGLALLEAVDLQRRAVWVVLVQRR